MNNIFEHSNSTWVRYSDYELKKDKNDILYVVPAKDAVPELYNPIKDAEQLVIDAINIGTMCIGKEAAKRIEMAVMDFVKKYGLLGIMTAIPTTPSFMDYEAVYLTKNPLLDDESMETFGYIQYFFPFEKPEISKNGKNTMWTSGDDVSSMAIALTMSNEPIAVNLSFQKIYAERYDWIIRLFKDWAFIFITSFLYYNDKDTLTDKQKSLYQKSIAIYDGIAPTYRISLKEDKPTLIWDFYSLATMIRVMFSFMLTDDKTPLRLCKHCQKAFVAPRTNAIFCSIPCKNKYSVYKTRKKNK